MRQDQTVEIIFPPVQDETANLGRLGDSGVAFWNNDTGDEVWNDAVPPA